MSGNRKDPATGRKVRDKVYPAGDPRRGNGLRPERKDGVIVPGGRLAFQRDKVTRPQGK